MNSAERAKQIQMNNPGLSIEQCYEIALDEAIDYQLEIKDNENTLEETD